MAIFRKIHVSFWSDTFTSELPNDKKLFYLYLLTNERTKQCGIYEISKRQISFDLGCNIDTVSKQLEYFIKIGKIQYSESTNEIAIKNWVKYNYSSSPKVVKCIESELKQVKNTLLIEYLNTIDTLSQEEEEKEEEEKQEKELIDWDILLNFFNKVTGKKSRVISENVKKQFKARLKEKYTKEDIKNAIINVCKDSYHIETNLKYVTLEFISRADKLDKFCQIVDQNNTGKTNQKLMTYDD